MPLVPNPSSLKVCSTLVLTIIAAGDPTIKDWCVRHALNPEQIAPGHLFAYGSDTGCVPHAFGCAYADALKA
jgi:hypothetical protein